MSLIGYLVLAAVLLLLAWQWSTIRAARRSEGQALPPLADTPLAPASGARRALIYFYSQRCGACRRTTPLIARLGEDYADRVFRIDIAAHPELAGRFGVRGTPTTVLVGEGAISRVYLGASAGEEWRRWRAG